MQSDLFAEANRETSTPGERWVRQSSKMLRVDTRGTDVIAAKGAMVAYQGDIRFEHEGSGSVGKFLKQAVTGESAPLTATYEANDYLVSLDAAGGIVVPSTLQITFDAPYGALPAPTRAGYDFDGWILELEGSTSIVNAETTVSTPFDHVLEAAWVLDATVDSIVLTPSGTATAQGGSVSFTAEGFNDAGLSVGDVTDDVTLSSDVATDVVEGDTVTFPTASPHTITGTHVDGATDDVVIEVEAAAVTPVPSAPTSSAPTPPAPLAGSQLPTTGAEPNAVIAVLALLLMAGGALALRQRARR